MSKDTEKKIPDLSRFDKYLKAKPQGDGISESLAEIYEDDKGARVNVREMNIRRRRSIVGRFGLAAVYLIIAAALVGGVYYWLVNRGADVTALDFSIQSVEGLKANQDFTYTLNFHNKEKNPLTNVEITVVYPDSFIFIDSSPATSEGNNKWRLQDMEGMASGQITIHGRIIAPTGQSNILFADFSYRPSGITSSFKKTASVDTILASSGIDIMTTAPGSALVGQEETMSITYAPQDKNYLNHFSLRLEATENVKVGAPQLFDGVSYKDPASWNIDLSKPAKKPLVISFKLLDKKVDVENIKLVFEYTPENSDHAYRFEEKNFPIDVIKNSLNLTMSANGSSADQGVDFGQTAQYSISYANKGETTMNDVIIMAVMNGDAIDWRKISDKNNGKVTGSSIIWTKEEVPALKTLLKGQEGTIDFSLPVRPLTEAKLISRYEINSYAQFSIGNKPEDLSLDNETNRSNQLSVKINSDISLDEAVRYFDQDNIAVGTGPLPPQANDTTTVKVYWTIANSLHEIGNLKVTTTLPSNVSWDGKDRAEAGSLSYDASTNKVTWDIGRLPLSVPSVSAEFSIALKPRTSDHNKLMILVSGTSLVGVDSQTGYPVSLILKSQTTKLERDDIANTDGIVQ